MDLTSRPARPPRPPRPPPPDYPLPCPEDDDAFSSVSIAVDLEDGGWGSDEFPEDEIEYGVIDDSKPGIFVP